MYAWASSGPDEERIAIAHLIIETLPPGTSPSDICTELANHRAIAAHDQPRHPATIPIGDLYDAGTDRRPIRIAITLVPGTNPDIARDQLAGLDGITTEQPAAYPAPLATLLRTWAHQYRDEDITTSLTILHHARRRIRGGGQPVTGRRPGRRGGVCCARVRTAACLPGPASRLPPGPGGGPAPGQGEPDRRGREQDAGDGEPAPYVRLRGQAAGLVVVGTRSRRMSGDQTRSSIRENPAGTRT